VAFGWQVRLRPKSAVETDGMPFFCGGQELSAGFGVIDVDARNRFTHLAGVGEESPGLLSRPAEFRRARAHSCTLRGRFEVDDGDGVRRDDQDLTGAGPGWR
jgi:hypothetical protein